MDEKNELKKNFLLIKYMAKNIKNFRKFPLNAVNYCLCFIKKIVII